MKRITHLTALVKFGAWSPFVITALHAPAQTSQTSLDLGPATDGHDVLVNPLPNSPLPPGVFIAADTTGLDNEIAFFDTSQPQSASNPSVVIPSPGLINRLGSDASLAALYSVGYVRKAVGNLYVAGHGRKATTSPYGWYVRRSSDGGNTWQTLLTNFSAGGDSLVNDAAVDGAGDLWVVGAANAANSATEVWAMQRWNPFSGWSGPMYPYGNPAPRSHARGATTDKAGRVYVTGWVFDSSGYSHAAVLEVNN